MYHKREGGPFVEENEEKEEKDEFKKWEEEDGEEEDIFRDIAHFEVVKGEDEKDEDY